MKKDSWGRYVRPEPEPDPRYQQQLTFTFSHPDATPEQCAEWHEKEGKWWADRSLTIVALCSVMQFLSIGFMLMSFYLIDLFAGH